MAVAHSYCNKLYKLMFVVAYIARKPELAWNWMIKPRNDANCFIVEAV